MRHRMPSAALLAACLIALTVAPATAGLAPQRTGLSDREQQRILDGPSLDGSGNNIAHPDRGQAGTIYPRVAPADYADGIGVPRSGVASPRYISNRVYNDLNQNVFSPRGVTQWATVWGQFVDHTIGLVQGGTEPAPLMLDPSDPLESFRSTSPTMPFTRSATAPGTGATTPRGQVNTVSSYLDGWAVYGGTAERLDWLRAGPANGNPGDNDPHLLLPDGYLPTTAARPEAAPAMERFSVQHIDPSTVVVAGDVRANENVALTALHTLFAREHNRIVDSLPADLPAEVKFQIARRVVIAEQQWITYQEFLPAMGVRLPPYRGYRPSVDSSISDEFATVGYRGHSQIHGELELTVEAGEMSAADLQSVEAKGVEVDTTADETELAIPLNVAFGRPELLRQIGVGPVLLGIGAESEYANDEMIDNQLRSVLFQSPTTEPDDCLDGPTLPECFTAVLDLGALDLARGYDHGIPSYNQLRVAYGLAPKTSFTAITGEATDALPAGTTIDDPAILAYTQLVGRDGQPVAAGTEAAANDVVGVVRGSTLAARLKAVYGTVDSIDAFTGMVSEAHRPGSEMGELQEAMWSRQFARLRDGDRYYYGNDPVLDLIARRFGVSYRHNLGELIVANTDITAAELPNRHVFRLPRNPRTTTPAPPAAPPSTVPGPPATAGGVTPPGPPTTSAAPVSPPTVPAAPVGPPTLATPTPTPAPSVTRRGG